MSKKRPHATNTLITKRQRIVDFSTRKHYAGEHLVEVLVNGKVRGEQGFELVM